MKREFSFNISLTIAVLLIACSGRHNSETTAKEVWPQMDEFHTIMAETFHPFKDSSNLEPVKANAYKLVEGADQWINSSIPKNLDEAKVNGKLKELKSETESLVNLVKENDDKAIAESLTKVHDLFHELQEYWYEHEEGKHDNDH